MNEENPKVLLARATGQADVEGAVAWIAEDHKLETTVSPQDVLQALTALAFHGEVWTTAIRRISKEVTKSSLDSGSVLVGTEDLPTLNDVRAVMDLLAWKSRDRTLGTISPEAVIAARRENPWTIEVLCAIAGISYSELRQRAGIQLPTDARESWEPAQVRVAFKIVDGIVRNTTETPQNMVPVRPVEFILGLVKGSGERAWQELERLRKDGVPYELLLVQRLVGDSWASAYKNRAAEVLRLSVVDRLCKLLDDGGIAYRRGKNAGGQIEKKSMILLAGVSTVGVVVLGLDNRPLHAIAFSAARDGGTARKNIKTMTEWVRETKVPTSVVVIGPGWSQRNETAELAIAFEGRIYADAAIEDLVGSLAAQISDSSV